MKQTIGRASPPGLPRSTGGPAPPAATCREPRTSRAAGGGRREGPAGARLTFRAICGDRPAPPPPGSGFAAQLPRPLRSLSGTSGHPAASRAVRESPVRRGSGADPTCSGRPAPWARLRAGAAQARQQQVARRRGAGGGGPPDFPPPRDRPPRTKTNRRLPWAPGRSRANAPGRRWGNTTGRPSTPAEAEGGAGRLGHQGRGHDGSPGSATSPGPAKAPASPGARGRRSSAGARPSLPSP